MPEPKLTEAEKKAKWAQYMRDYKKKNARKIADINNRYYHKRVNELKELRAFKAMILADEKKEKEEKVTK